MRQYVMILAALSLLAGACSSGENGPTETAPVLSSAPPTSTIPTATTGAATIDSPPTSNPSTHPEIPTPEVSDLESLLALGRPTVMAHAGGDRSWPHSTMYAYYQSALAGADVLEMDVQLTGDGVLVVQHDDTVDKATNGTGRVRDMTYDQLQALDKAYWYSDEWASHDLPDSSYIYRGIRTGDTAAPDGFSPDDFAMATWRSIAETFPDHPLDIEIKIPDGDDGNPDLPFAIEGARVLAREITELGRTNSVIVTSFNDEVLDAFRKAAPEVATSPGLAAMYGWITGTGTLQPSDRVLQLPPSYEGLTVISPSVLARAHAEGLAVWEWADSGSQESADFYSLMAAMGVDGVIAGRPGIAVDRFRADRANPADDDLSILVTNDDGVGAPGLDALVEALRDLPGTTIRVVAPAENQSGTSDSTTEPLPTWTYATTASGFPAFAVDGFPADSVIVALDVLAFTPDLVIAGINEGQNIGPLVEISGTVGAARTAARAGIQALAASQGIGDPPDFAAGVERVLAWVESFRGRPRFGFEIGVDNLNIPTCTSGTMRGLVIVSVATDPAGRNAFESDCAGDPPPDQTDDIGAFMNGWATISPLGY